MGITMTGPNMMLMVLASSLVLTPSGLSATKVVAFFSTGIPDQPFQMMVRDKKSGHMYVGGTNRLLQLSEDLELLQEVETGPMNDSKYCPPPSVNCTCPYLSGESHLCDKYNKILTDSITKALVIDSSDRKLVHCSSLFQGSCEKMSLTDLTIREPIYDAVVSPDPHVPVSMYIGLGPGGSKNLYIGSSWSEKSQYSNASWANVPLVSSRDTQTMEIAKQSERGKTALYMKEEFRKNKFVVLYKYGFAYNGFSYFLTVQKKGKSYESRIVRVCQNDQWFYSYNELELQCGEAGEDGHAVRYNVLMSAHLGNVGGDLAEKLGMTGPQRALFATFAQGYEESSIPMPSSALCVYSMKNIEQMFATLVGSCFGAQDTAQIGPAHIADVTECQQLTVAPGITNRYCGVYGTNHPIEGVGVAVDSIQRLEFPGTLLTAVVSDLVNGKTVAYMGSKQGQLEKIVLDWVIPGLPIPRKQIGHQKIAVIENDLTLDNNGLHLYFRTGDTIYKMETSECGVHSTCEDCQAARDPHCGWCVWNNRCSQKGECSVGGWVATTCPSITSIEPGVLQYASLNTTQVMIETSFLPSHESLVLQCILREGEFTEEVGAEAAGGSVTCHPFIRLPPVSPITGYLWMDLIVNADGHDLFHRKIQIYDCTTLTSCVACSNSSLECAWCVDSHRCTYKSALSKQCHNQDVVYAQQISGDFSQEPEVPRGPYQCPRIGPPMEEIQVAAGVASAIGVYGYNIKSWWELACEYSLDNGTVLSVSANLELSAEDDTKSLIICRKKELGYDAELAFSYVAVNVVRVPDMALDNPNNVQVKLYKCAYMVTDCGRCLTMDVQYGCGWCGETCEQKHDCNGTWLNRTATCPGPLITRFVPQSGPLSGSTKIVVHGVNLGKAASDLMGGVTVAGVPCEVQEEGYEPSTTFTCVNKATLHTKNGTVQVTVKGLYSGSSTTKFAYVDPVVYDFHPPYGAVSGGTAVTVIGHHLDAGSNVKLSLGKQTATIAWRNTTHLEFATPSQKQPQDTELRFDFDHTIVVSDDLFEYRSDPVVTEVTPLNALTSGGSNMTFKGSNMNAVHSPKMVTTVNHISLTTDCVVESEHKMSCVVPDLSNIETSKSETSSMWRVRREEPSPQDSQAHYGLLMDGVLSLRNLSQLPGFEPITVHPNPKVFPLDEVVIYEEGATLTIQGAGLGVLEVVPGLEVMIGGTTCNVTQIQDQYLVCMPPPDTSVDEEGLAAIKVELGNFGAEVGVMKYPSSSSSPPLLIAVVFGVAIPILLMILLVFFCLRRNSRKHKKRRRHNYDNNDAEVSPGDLVLPSRYPIPARNPARRSLPDIPAEQMPLRGADISDDETDQLRPPFLTAEEAIPLRPHLHTPDEGIFMDSQPSPSPDPLNTFPRLETLDNFPSPDDEDNLHSPQTLDSPRFPDVEALGVTTDEEMAEDTEDEKENRKSADLSETGSDSKTENYYSDSSSPRFLKNLLNNMEDAKLRESVVDVLVPKDNIELGRVLGKGHFGRVYHGIIKEGENNDKEVAVKTLQGRHLDQMAVESFLKEGVMMKNFNHPHVLRLLGVVMSEGEYPMVLLPFMANGDLRSFVKNKSQSFTARQLLKLAQQVAQGMTYLASLNFVHRDLAARNCMIDDQKVVKVADFGLSKDLYDKDYYASKDRRRKMPIKWMALESLEDYVFTTKSDVWSFGVLLWELLTRGVTPYPDVDVFEVRNYLVSGRRLRQPKYCPENVYRIMKECWAADSSDRPAFVDLVNRLEMIINPPKKSNPSASSSDEPFYVNIRELNRSHSQDSKDSKEDGNTTQESRASGEGAGSTT